MTIKKAIAEAKRTCNWSVVDHEPTSVNVGFFNLAEGREDETQFDTWGDNPEKELEDLWNDLCKEFNSSRTNVLYVEALGYIQD